MLSRDLCVRLNILVLVLFFSITANAQNKNSTVVIRNVTVVDMVSDRPKPGMTVVVSGDRISGISRSAKVPAGAQVIDGTGKYLIPGLWDNYTYTLEAVKNKLPFFELLLAHGITGVRDVGTSMDLAEAARLRSEINAGELLGPRLFYAGTVLIGAMPPRRSIRWSVNSTVVKTAEEARKVVGSFARAGVDHIKTEKRMPPELLREITRAADEHTLPVVGVPPSFLIDGSNDGLDCLEHFAEVRRETSDKRDEYYAVYRDGKIDTMTTDENYAFFGTMKPDVPYYNQSLKTLAQNKTCVVTNTAMFDSFIGEYELSDASRRRFKNKQQLQRLEAAIAEGERQARNKDHRASDEGRETTLQVIRDMHKAGIMLLAGTQLNPLAVGTPGLVLHDELSLFVRAGLPPFEALKTATVNPAKFMRREKDLGTIEKGKLADLVLLDANPFSDISNTRKINAVISNGRYLSRKFLDQMLAEVEASAKNK